jgi:hypothetical protein
MNESSWSGMGGEVADSSGLLNNGTASPDATTTLNGKFGRGGLFPGAGFVTVPHAASLQPTSAVSYAAWVYFMALSGGGSSDAPGIIAKRNSVGDAAFTLFLWAGNYLYVDIDTINDRFHSKTVFQTNTWYHVAVVYDGSLLQAERVRLYVNGVLDTTAPETSATIPPGTAPVFVGTLPAGGQDFTGVIDEVAIWTRPLQDAEVAFLFAATQEL